MSKTKLVLGISAAGLIAGLAIGPAVVSAAIVKRNDTTGPNSWNINRTNLRDRVRDERRNIGDVKNNVDVDEETGQNNTEKNTTAGDIDTGHANTTVVLTNELNQSDGDDPVVPDAPDTDITEVNTMTGPKSTNKNILNMRITRTYEQVNRADVRNRVEVDSSTGHNNMEKNTAGGSTMTGNATTNIDILNIVN